MLVCQIQTNQILLIQDFKYKQIQTLVFLLYPFHNDSMFCHFTCVSKSWCNRTLYYEKTGNVPDYIQFLYDFFMDIKVPAFICKYYHIILQVILFIVYLNLGTIILTIVWVLDSSLFQNRFTLGLELLTGTVFRSIGNY